MEQQENARNVENSMLNLTGVKSRFWDKVRRESDCWIWIGGLNSKGYGCLSVEGKIESASHVSWELNFGPIPDGFDVLHKCDTPRCVNPDHLFLGTHTDNMQDKVKKGRHHNSIITHCPRFHEYTVENTKINKNGGLEFV